MRIALPPPRMPHEFNLRKQADVFRLVYDPGQDQLLSPEPLGTGAYSRVHDPAYVYSVLYGGGRNGWGDSDQSKLHHVRWSCQAFVAACRSAVDGGGCVFAPVSGFHHAGYAHGGGYCTFNGLMLAAAVPELSKPILIIDGDGHYGDGTEELIVAHPKLNVTQLSLDKGAVRGSHELALRRIGKALAAEDWGLVMYQAGADAHKDDPSKAGYLSDSEFYERDAVVFSACKAMGLPVVWNLAGGYNGRKTIALHTSTFEQALRVYEPGRTRLPASQDVLSGILDQSGPPAADPG